MSEPWLEIGYTMNDYYRETQILKTTRRQMNVPINDIHIQSNVRSTIDKSKDDFKGLVKDIGINGLIQPLVVYETDNKYTLIAGHRRLEALKELNKKTVDVYVRTEPNGDFTQLQVSENTMRKDLTLFEEVVAFKSMVDTKMTISEVADKFGHSHDYVVRRVELGNLTEYLLKAEVFESDEISERELRRLAKNHKSIQKEAIKWAADKMKTTPAKYVKAYLDDNITYKNNFLNYPGLIENKIARDVMVEFCEGEENFAKHHKDYGYRVKTTPVLFQDPDYTDYCSDNKFIHFVAKERYPKEYETLKSVKVDGNMNYWDTNCGKSSMPKIFMALQKGVKITSWNGNWFDPILRVPGTGSSSSSKTSTPTQQDKYYRQTKKFGKTLAGDYLAYFKNQLYVPKKKGSAPLIICGTNGETVDKWIQKMDLGLANISVGEYQDGYNLERIRKHLSKDASIADLKGSIYKCLVLESMNHSSFKLLNQLAKSLGIKTLKQWFTDEWKMADNEQFKLDVFSCFSLSNLSHISTGKKVDIIDYAIQKNTPFPFMSIFSSKEAEWDTLSLKFNYLDKKTLYSGQSSY